MASRRHKSWPGLDVETTQCQAPTAYMRHPLEVCLVSGTKVCVMERGCSRNRPFNKIREDTLIEDLFDPCSVALNWHVEFIKLVLDDKVFRFNKRIAERTRTRILDLISPADLLQQKPCRINVVLEMPENFGGDCCLCSFGGCCKLCRVPGGRICPGCGNNGCCRASNCGCACCEENLPCDGGPRCPFKGCRPEWADPKEQGQTLNKESV